MTTQYSPILKLALPVQGELSGTWGNVVNDNITSMVEQAIAGRAVINSWSTNSHTLTSANGTTSESRCAMLELTDTGTALSGAGTVICPALSKIYIVKNAAGQNITVKTASGTGVLIPNGRTTFLFCDGTNVVEALTHTTSLQLGTSTTVTAVLDEDNMASNSATSLATQQSIKAYVDSKVGQFDSLSEVLAVGNTTGSNNIIVNNGQKITTNTIDETTAGSGVTIDSVLLKDDVVNATDVETGSISANDGTTAATIANSTGVVTVPSAVLTTADINGGTADGVVIGGSTPAAATVTTATANTSLNIAGTTTVTSILDEDNMASNSATSLATQQSIKTYVDAQVGTVDTLAEVLANGNTTGGNDIVFSAGDNITNASGDLTLDVAGNIVLNADAGGIYFKDAGDEIGLLANTGNNFVLMSRLEDKDIIFKGKDGSSTITALTLDMSEAGAATFNSTVTASSYFLGSGSEISLATGSAGNIFLRPNGQSTSGQMQLASSGTATFNAGAIFNAQGNDVDFRVASDSNANMLFVDGGNNRVGIASSSPDDILTVGGETLAYANALDGHTLGIRGGVLGGTAGDEKDIAYFAVESTSNNTLGLSLKAYRKSTGNDWTSAGFKYTLNVDNTDSVYDNLLVFQGSKIGIHTDEPAGVLHIHSDSASGATYGIVQNDGTANTNTIAGWVIRDGTTVMGGVRRRRDGAGSPIEMGNFSNDATVDLLQNNERRITFDTSSNIVVNEPGIDTDFRVESDSNSNMLFVDAGNDRVTVGSNSTYSMFNVVSSNDNTSDWWTNSVATQYMQNTVGHTVLKMNNNNSNRSAYLVYNGNGSAQGFHIFDRQTEQSRISAYANDVVINDAGANVDFRVESDSNANMLVVDASTNRIGIKNSAPTAGDLSFDSSATVPSGDSPSAAKISLYGNNNDHLIGVDNGGAYHTTNTSWKVIAKNGSTYAGDLLTLTTGANGATFNEGSQDIDFRVESNGNSHMLFVNAGTDTVQIGSSTATNYGTFPIPSLYAKGRTDGKYGIVHFEGQADDSVLGLGHDSTGNYFVFNASYRSNGAFSSLQFHDTSNQSALTLGLQSATAESVFNDSGANKDFRVESDNNAHMLFVDASLDQVVVGSSVGSGVSGLSNGFLVINQGNTNKNGMVIYNQGENYSAYTAKASNNTGSRYFGYWVNSSANNVGGISYTSTGSTFLTTSDRRLKDNIEPIADGTDKLMAMNPVTHKWKADPEAPAVHGFIAQEMQEVVPEAVLGEPDGEEMMSMDYGRITPVLVAALQEATNEIKALKQRVSELEDN
jgi:hypothetical protein